MIRFAHWFQQRWVVKKSMVEFPWFHFANNLSWTQRFVCKMVRGWQWWTRKVGPLFLRKTCLGKTTKRKTQPFPSTANAVQEISSEFDFWCQPINRVEKTKSQQLRMCGRMDKLCLWCKRMSLEVVGTETVFGVARFEHFPIVPLFPTWFIPSITSNFQCLQRSPSQLDTHVFPRGHITGGILRWMCARNLFTVVSGQIVAAACSSNEVCHVYNVERYDGYMIYSSIRTD